MLLRFVLLLLSSQICYLDALLQNFTYPWFLALQECPDYHGSTSTIADCQHFCTAVVLSEDQKLIMLPAHCLLKNTGKWHIIHVKLMTKYLKIQLLNFRVS